MQRNQWATVILGVMEGVLTEVVMVVVVPVSIVMFSSCPLLYIMSLSRSKIPRGDFCSQLLVRFSPTHTHFKARFDYLCCF